MVNVPSPPHLLESVDGVHFLSQPPNMHEKICAFDSERFHNLLSFLVFLYKTKDSLSVIFWNVLGIVLHHRPVVHTSYAHFAFFDFDIIQLFQLFLLISHLFPFELPNFGFLTSFWWSGSLAGVRFLRYSVFQENFIESEFSNQSWEKDVSCAHQFSPGVLEQHCILNRIVTWCMEHVVANYYASDCIITYKKV